MFLSTFLGRDHGLCKKSMGPGNIYYFIYPIKILLYSSMESFILLLLLILFFHLECAYLEFFYNMKIIIMIYLYFKISQDRFNIVILNIFNF